MLYLSGLARGDRAPGKTDLTSHAWSTPTESTIHSLRMQAQAAGGDVIALWATTVVVHSPPARILMNHRRQFVNLLTVKIIPSHAIFEYIYIYKLVTCNVVI